MWRKPANDFTPETNIEASNFFMDMNHLLIPILSLFVCVLSVSADAAENFLSTDDATTLS